MSQDLPREVLRQYQRKLALLEDEAGHLKTQLAEVERGIEIIERAVAAQQEALEAYPELYEGDPSKHDPARQPPAPQVDASGAAQAGAPDLVAVKTSGTRREQILHLLGQDSTRWWKARDIANAVHEDNLKSLRVTISKMAQQGDLTRVCTSARSAWFRFNDGVDRPAPQEGHQYQAREQGAAM